VSAEHAVVSPRAYGRDGRAVSNTAMGPAARGSGGYKPGPLARRLLGTIGIDVRHLRSTRSALPYLVAGFAMCLYLPYGTWAISHALSLANAGSGHVTAIMIAAAAGVTAVIIGFDALIIGHVPVNTERLGDSDERPLGRLSKAMVALRLVIAAIMLGVFTIPTLLFFFQKETIADLASTNSTAISRYEKNGEPARLQAQILQLTSQENAAPAPITHLVDRASSLDQASASDYQLALADSAGNGVSHLAGCPTGGDCWTLKQKSQQEATEAASLRQQAQTLQAAQHQQLVNDTNQIAALTTRIKQDITQFTDAQNNNTGLGARTKSLVGLAVHDPYGIGLAAAIVLAVAALLELAVIGIKVTASRNSEYELSVARVARTALWADEEVDAAATAMSEQAVADLRHDEALIAAIYEQKRNQLESVFRERIAGPLTSEEPPSSGASRMQSLRRRGATRWVAGAAAVALVAGGAAYAVERGPGYQATIHLRDGGELIVPAGTIGQNRPVQAAYRTDQQIPWAGHEALAPTVTFTTTGTLVGQPTLDFVVPPSKRADAAAGLTEIAYLTPSGWQAYPSSYDPKTGILSAHLAHFSSWAPWDWDWASIGADISQQILQVEGSRTDKRPSCNTSALPTPSWLNASGTAGINVAAGLVILDCQQGHAGDDTLDVQIVNNRPYGMILTYGSGVRYGWHEDGATVGEALRNAIGDYVAHQAGGLYLPPLSAAAVGIANPNRNGGQLIFPVSASAGTAVADLAEVTSDELLKGLGTGVGKALGVTTAQAMASSQECVTALGNWAPGALDISQGSASDLFTSAVPGCVKDILVQAGRALISSGNIGSTEFAAVNSMVNRLNPVAALADLADWGRKLAVVGDYFIDKQFGWVPDLGYGFSLLLHYSYSPAATSPPAISPPAISPPATSPPATSPPATSPPATSPPATSAPPPPTTSPPTRTVAYVYNNYGNVTAGIPMCRGNTNYPSGHDLPGGSFSQTMTVPAGVGTINTVEIQIDQVATMTATLTLNVNGTTKASASATPVGNTVFHFADVPVSHGESVSIQVALSDTGDSARGQIVTIYEAAAGGGVFSYSNSCVQDSQSGSSSSNTLEAIVSGWSD
jgi:Domain of unknown function (DUF4407)